MGDVMDFKVGDLVRVDDGLYQGTVIDISLRDTVILTVTVTDFNKYYTVFRICLT